MTEGGQGERCGEMPLRRLSSCYMYEVNACIFNVWALLFVLSREKDHQLWLNCRGSWSELYFRLARERPLIKGMWCIQQHHLQPLNSANIPTEVM